MFLESLFESLQFRIWRGEIELNKKNFRQRVGMICSAGRSFERRATTCDSFAVVAEDFGIRIRAHEVVMKDASVKTQPRKQN